MPIKGNGLEDRIWLASFALPHKFYVMIRLHGRRMRLNGWSEDIIQPHSAQHSWMDKNLAPFSHTFHSYAIPCNWMQDQESGFAETFCNSLDILSDEAGVLRQTFQAFAGHFIVRMTGEGIFTLDILSDDQQAGRQTFSKFVRHVWRDWWISRSLRNSDQ